MWTRLAFIIEFFKDLFFDTTEESHFSSSQFNSRKFTIFLMVIALFSFNSFLLNRIIHLTTKVQDLGAKLKTCEKTDDSKIPNITIPLDLQPKKNE